MDQFGGLIELCRVPTVAQAHLLKNLLDDAGIDARLDNDLLQGATGDIPLGWSTMPRLFVPSADKDKALRIVQRFRSPPPGQKPRGLDDGTRCLACGAVFADEDERCRACGWTYAPDEAES